MIVEKKREVNLSWIKKYNESTNNLSRLIPNKTFIDAGWNKSSNIPVEFNTPIFTHPDQDGVSEKYIRVVYSEYNAIAVFSKNNFIWG